MKKLIIYTLAAGLVLTFQACTKDFDELNKNPAGFDNLDPQFMLAKVQADMSGDREDTWRYDLGICSPLIQHLAGSWWTQHGGHYNISEKNHWYSHWESTYPREVKNIENIIQRTKGDPKQHNMYAAARILRVYIYSKLTDLYGDIPYFDASKGITDRNFTPNYDKQEDIYKDFFKELEEAVNSLDPNKGQVKGDVFLSGSVERWKKFGNSLRMRLGFRLVKVNLAEARKQVEAAISKGVMTEINDMAICRHEAISYSSGENRGNGRSQVFKASARNEGFRLVSTLVDTMVNRKDPRLYIYGGTYSGEGIVGMSSSVKDITGIIPAIGILPGAFWWSYWSDFGDGADSSGNYVYVGQADKQLQPSKYVTALNAPFFHMTLAEVEFLLAEAAARNWTGVTDAHGHFNKGVQAGIEVMKNYPNARTITQAQIDDCKASYNSYFGAGFNKAMEAIHEQLWISFFLNGNEAYANWRRSGLPILKPVLEVEGVPTTTNGAIPRRFFYPQSELIQNGNNLREAVSRLGGTDDWLKRVWWDKQ